MLHPAHPGNRSPLWARARFEAVMAAPGKLLGGLFGTSTPAAPAPVAQPAAPTVDQAAVNANQQAQSDQAQAQKKGALSTLLNTGNTQTGDQLGAAAPETTLKRFLGS